VCACVPVCLCACVPVCLCACVPVCLCACVPVLRVDVCACVRVRVRLRAFRVQWQTVRLGAVLSAPAVSFHSLGYVPSIPNPMYGAHAAPTAS
jgi:hypothetical protein